jgi:thiamine-phosphate pyrophosphorylase
VTAVEPFPALPLPAFRLYPVVDSADWVRRLIRQGVPLVQLRLKTRPAADPEREISRAVADARASGATLIVNDHWHLALRWRAAGVHLSRPLWGSADLAALGQAGMLLGVSVHDEAEIETATRLQPSYMSLGTVLPSTSKRFAHRTLGMEGFSVLRQRIQVPVAAVGGLLPEHCPELRRRGADLVSAISGLTGDRDLAGRLAEWRWALDQGATLRNP